MTFSCLCAIIVIVLAHGMTKALAARKAVSACHTLANCLRPLKKTALSSLLSSRWAGLTRIHLRGINDMHTQAMILFGTGMYLYIALTWSMKSWINNVMGKIIDGYYSMLCQVDIADVPVPPVYCQNAESVLCVSEYTGLFITRDDGLSWILTISDTLTMTR